MYDDRGRVGQKEALFEQNFEASPEFTAMAGKRIRTRVPGRIPRGAGEAPVARAHYRRCMPAKRTIVTAWKQASAQQAPLLAAGVAFYTFLSLFPALIAGVLTYGLVASPETVGATR